MIVAITGTRSLDDTGRQHLFDAVSMLDPLEDSLVVGGCVGADAFAALVATGFGLPTFAVVPLLDTKWVERWCDPDWALFASLGWSSAASPRTRNAEMVERADQVWAFPDRDEARDNPRSGTWMTVRMARRANKLTLLLVQHPHANGGRA